MTKRVEVKAIHGEGVPFWTVEEEGVRYGLHRTRADAIQAARTRANQMRRSGQDASVLIMRWDGSIDHLESFTGFVSRSVRAADALPRRRVAVSP